MAVKVESLSGIHIGTPILPTAPRPVPGLLTRQQRVAQVRRRRRLATVRGAVESALWIGGSGALITLSIAGLFGLR